MGKIKTSDMIPKAPNANLPARVESIHKYFSVQKWRSVLWMGIITCIYLQFDSIPFRASGGTYLL